MLRWWWWWSLMLVVLNLVLPLKHTWCRVNHMWGACLWGACPIVVPTSVMFKRTICYNIHSTYRAVLGCPSPTTPKPTNVINHIYTSTKTKKSIKNSSRDFIKHLEHKINQFLNYHIALKRSLNYIHSQNKQVIDQ